MKSCISDDLLIEAVQAGETEKFMLLAEPYVGKIFGLAFHMTNNPYDAEDILQDVLLRAFSKLPTFRGDSAFATWIYKIALNTTYMKLRERRRASEENIDEYLPEFDRDGRILGAVWSFPVNPENEAIQKELSGILWRAIEQLPLDYRIVIVAREIEQLSTDETAAALGLTDFAVKSRLHRARLFLREKLQETIAVAS